MIKAALFDMDGTMFDTERLSVEGWVWGAAQCGCGLTREQVLEFRGRPMKVNAAAFACWYGSEELYHHVRSYRTLYVEKYIAEHGVPLKPGLFELLKVLKEKGIKTCIATGTARPQAKELWEKTGVLPWFDATVCGDEMKIGKPDPEPFLKAAAAVSEAPENCVVFEDSPNGLLSAHRAGCMVIDIPDLDEPAEEIRAICDYVFPTLLEAAELVKTWAAVEAGKTE